MYKCLKLVWYFPSQSCSAGKFYCFQKSAIKDQTSTASKSKISQKGWGWLGSLRVLSPNWAQSGANQLGLVHGVTPLQLQDTVELRIYLPSTQKNPLQVDTPRAPCCSGGGQEWQECAFLLGEKLHPDSFQESTSRQNVKFGVTQRNNLEKEFIHPMHWHLRDGKPEHAGRCSEHK